MFADPVGSPEFEERDDVVVERNRCPYCHDAVPIHERAICATSAVDTGQITAAGKVPPAKILVIGAGVVGLQAIETALRRQSPPA